MSAPSIKSAAEITAMREGGKILARILHETATQVRPGITTKELDLFAENLMKKYDVAPSFKGYNGFPAVLCTSVNEEVVHAIPGKRVLHEGDIISIDGGVIHKGLHSDACVTVGVGKIDDKNRHFIETAYRALESALAELRPGARAGDVGAAIEKFVGSRGYSVTHDFIGHGIGYKLHEPPEIPNYGKRGKGPLFLPNMTICIEPIILMGERYTKTLEDDWTAVSKDGSRACQVEHTILITEDGYEVLTKLE